MVVSMTGFGRSRNESEKFVVTVEIKTVNHRFTEYNIRMPRQLLKIEDKLKKKIGEYVSRGRVEVFITIEGTGAVKSKIHVDWILIDEYFDSIQKMKEKYNLPGEISLQDLLSRQDFISIHEEESSNEELVSMVMSAIENAAIHLKQMRLTEGSALEKDVEAHLMDLENKVQQLNSYTPIVVKHYSDRLRKRMEEFSNGLLDEARMVNEVAIFADKADINEELTRLQSHIAQFYKNLKLNDSNGRKLDFLLQEMNREINTIGSKANDSGIATEVVEMKSLLEKMKEQVQNIE